jgi:hypothetical protein
MAQNNPEKIEEIVVTAKRIKSADCDSGYKYFSENGGDSTLADVLWDVCMNGQEIDWEQQIRESMRANSKAVEDRHVILKNLDGDEPAAGAAATGTTTQTNTTLHTGTSGPAIELRSLQAEFQSFEHQFQNDCQPTAMKTQTCCENPQACMRDGGISLNNISELVQVLMTTTAEIPSMTRLCSAQRSAAQLVSVVNQQLAYQCSWGQQKCTTACLEPQKDIARFIKRVGDVMVAAENASPATHARADWLLQEAEVLKQKFKVSAGHCLPGSSANTARVKMEQQAYATAVGAKYAQVCADHTAATNDESAATQSVNESALSGGAAVNTGAASERNNPTETTPTQPARTNSSFRADSPTSPMTVPTSTMTAPAATKVSLVMGTAYTWGAGAAAILNKARVTGTNAAASGSALGSANSNASGGYTSGYASGYTTSGGYQAYTGRRPIDLTGGSASQAEKTTEYLKSFLPGNSRHPASVRAAGIAPAHHDLFKKISDRYLAVCLRGDLYDCTIPRR